MLVPMAINLVSQKEGILLPVLARPSGRCNAITGEHDGMLKVSVTCAPEKGKANKAIIDLLSKKLHVAKSCIEICSGETASKKRFLIRGVNESELRALLEGLLE